jgi:hypothetical protein
VAWDAAGAALASADAHGRVCVWEAARLLDAYAALGAGAGAAPAHPTSRTRAAGAARGMAALAAGFCPLSGALFVAGV